MKETKFEILLADKENKGLDFKLDLPDSEKTASLVTAFYNSRGGKIILGVDDNRQPVGLENPQGTEHKFTQIIRHWCKLDEDPRIEFMKYNNMDFIIIHCPKGRKTPYFVRGKPAPKVRIGSSVVDANREEIARLYREGSSESQDTSPVKHAALDDLDLTKIKEYFRKSSLTKQLKKDYLRELMLKEHFAADDNGKITPTIAGILLFGKNPYLNIPYSTVRADRFVGDRMIEWLDREDVKGTLFDIAERLEKFFLRNMRTPAKVVGFRETRIRTEYPIEVLKESVINALVHRDWHNREDILVRMFDSKVEIISPGEVLRPLTIEELEGNEYTPVTRNNVLAKVFGDLGMMDKRGTGFLRIREALEKWELPKPEIEEKLGRFIIRFRNPYVRKIPDIDALDLNERQKEALKYIEEHRSISNEEYRNLFNIVDRTALRDLDELIKKNLIKRIRKRRGARYVFV